jgi:hypothetical protein
MKKIICFLFQVLVLFVAQAQQKYQPDKIIPPSPTAASLGEYGNIQVGYYSGIPDIKIPIYNLKTNSHSLNVQLNYTSTGFKPMQDASWVGLGWALSCGGVITRTIRGKDDFDSNHNGYYELGVLPPYNQDENSYVPVDDNLIEQGFFKGVNDNSKDGDPDLFSYNFGDYSGKFVLGKSVDGSKIYFDNKNNLKMEYINQKWIATDAKGYKFYFGTKEVAQDWYANSSYEFNGASGLNGLMADLYANNYVTAWYLDSLTSPSRELIKFDYTNGESLSLLNKYEKEYNGLIRSNACSPGWGSAEIPIYDKRYSASRQVISEKYLKKISFSLGSIEFETSNREDIDFKDANNRPQKLSRIIVKNLKGKLLTQFQLFYSYFNNMDPGSRRLKLDSLVEIGNQLKLKKPYLFTYIDGGAFPGKETKAIDHWGFYNGRSNSTLLPPSKGIYPDINLPGADRNPDTIGYDIKNGILSSIKYPTGGWTDFEYEVNDYAHLKGNDAFTEDPVPFAVQVVNNNPATIIQKANFVLTERKNVDISFVADETGQFPSDPNGLTDIYGFLEKDGQTIAMFSNYPPGGHGYVDTKNLDLEAGSYSIVAKYQLGYVTTVTASYRNKIPVFQKKGGGLRIKSIRNFDGSGVSQIKKYLYKDKGISSGRLMVSPIYESVLGFRFVSSNCASDPQYLVRMSNSVSTPGLSSTNTIVGYEKVTELAGENGENGKTEYYYYNYGDNVDLYPGVPGVGHPLNGKLRKSIVYNSVDIPIKKKEYDYDIKDASPLKGVKVFSMPWQNDFSQSWKMHGLPFTIRYYDNFSNWVVNSYERETVYNLNDSVVKAKFIDYKNNIHLMPTRISTITSARDTIRHIYKYPLEMINEGRDPSGVYSLMNVKHILDPVIEDISFNDKGNQLRNNRTNYSTWPNDIINPRSQEIQISNGPPQLILEYRSYDDKGNVLNVGRSDANTSYKWGYNQQLPIAEVKNATQMEFYFNNFEDLPNSTGIAHTGKGSGIGMYTVTWTRPNDRNYVISYFYRVAGIWKYKQEPYVSNTLVLSGGDAYDDITICPEDALIKTFTYELLEGMTSQIDENGKTIYYEYDDFQRLKFVKDRNGNIIKNNTYNYKK